MGRKIAGDRHKNVSAGVGIVPRSELSDSCLQYLVGVEACIFAQRGARERGDQCLRRMTKREMSCHEPCREIDLSLPVKSVKQSSTDCLNIGGEIVELLIILARKPGRRHIQI